jgi:GNAT superfamily N-acetyltransferase
MTDDRPVDAELQVPDVPEQIVAWAHVLVPQAIVAESPEGVVGYAYWSSSASPFHVAQIVVDRAWRGRRVGEAMLQTLADVARSRGVSSWTLNVKEENTSAIRLYERVGFAVVARSISLRMSREALDKLPVFPAEVVGLTNASLVESVLGLPSETVSRRLASLSDGIGLVVQSETGEICGVAAISPWRGGTGLFRLNRIEAARPFIEGILRRLPGRNEVHLWVEENEPLANLLLAAGGQTNFRAFRMQGLIPQRRSRGL